MDPTLMGLTPVEPTMIPSNIPDLVYYAGTAIIVFLMSVISVLLGLILYFGKQWAENIKTEVSTVVKELGITKIDQKHIGTKLDDHIADDNKHCKGLACPNSVRG